MGSSGIEVASGRKPAETNVRLLMFLAATAALGGLLFGFDIAIITGAGPFLLEHFHLGDIGLGWAFSSLLFGCVLGSSAAGKLSDRYGRRRILIWVAALFAGTSLATALAPTFSLFVAARFAGGVAVGAVSLLSPMYIAEVSPPSVRGRLGTLYQMSIVTGILISYSINYLLRNSGPENWRWMFSTGIVPSAAFLLLILLAPETPRFLMMVGKQAEAFSLLERIGGTANAEVAVAEMNATMHQSQTTWKGLHRPGVKRALIVSFGLAILIHVSGINTIIDYAPAIFRSAGWKMDAALFSTFLVGVTEFLATIVSFWVIDRYGRKPLYIIGSLGMTAALIGLIAAVWMNAFQGTLVLTLIVIYLIFFAACVGPVFWTLVPEIFPSDVRGLAMSVPVLAQWVANAVMVLFFPFAFHQIGKAPTFAFLAAMSLAQGIFTWLFVPETKNKRLEEIEGYWNRPKKIQS